MKNYIKKLIDSDRGNAADNLYRAKMAFRSKTPQQMQEKYGQSSETCQDILDGYIEWEKKAKDAMDFINSSL